MTEVTDGFSPVNPSLFSVMGPLAIGEDAGGLKHYGRIPGGMPDFVLSMAEKNPSEHKLDPKAQDWLLQAIAEYWKPKHIFEHLKEHFSIESYSYQSLSYQRKHNRAQIAKRRKKYLEDFESVDLAQKKVRIDKLAKKYDKLEEIPIDIATADTLDVIQRQQAILEQIRKEMEGDFQKLPPEIVIRVVDERVKKSDGN